MVINNDAFIVIDDSAFLVIDNPNADAMSTAGSGGNVISENENDVIRWNIGTTTGSYVIPWTTTPVSQGGNGAKVPLTIDITSAGVGAGYFEFSTYETATDNNTPFPTGVTNMGVPDRSLFTGDRFWRIDTAQYTTNPTATLEIKYDPAINELGIGNTIVEPNLLGQRFNTLSASWEDLVFGINDHGADRIHSIGVTPSNFFPFWSIIDPCSGDVLNPVVVCKDTAIYLDVTGSFVLDSNALDNGSTDNCSIASITMSQMAFTCSDIGINNVIVYVADSLGNTDSCASIVTVLDTIDPVPVCQNINVYLDGSGNAIIDSSDVDNGSTDNCSITSITLDRTSFNCTDLGVNSVTLTATDLSGNIDSCTSSVTVIDTVSPIPICQNINVYLDGSGNATIDSSDVDNGSTDNCGITSIALDKTSFNCADLGVNSVTLTATDASGNVASCSSQVTVLDTFNFCDPPNANFIASDTGICENECVNFTDASSNTTSWSWTFNGGFPSTSSLPNPSNICFSTEGTYAIQLIVSNGNGSDTSTFNITVNNTPTIYAGEDVVINLTQSVTLSVTGTNGTYSWSPIDWLSCINCASTVSQAEETITYTVAVVDSNSCVASDDIIVTVLTSNILLVPDIFSPNDDGKNDILYVRGQNIESLNFLIYNRWGELVFESNNINLGWDGRFRGKKMNKGVFVYYVEATFKDGQESSIKGDFTLVR